MVLSGTLALLELVNPYLTKLIIDDAIGNRNIKTFIILVLIGIGVFFIDRLLSSFRNFLDRFIKLKVNYDINKRVFQKMQNFPLMWFQHRTTGQNIYRASEDIDRTTEFITETPPQAFLIVPKFLFTLVMVFYLNWKLALLALSLAPLMVLSPYFFTAKMKRVWKRMIENSESIYEYLQETFSRIKVVKAFGKELSGVSKYMKLMAEKVKIGVHTLKLEIFSSFTMDAINKIIIGLIMFYGGYQVIKGEFTLGGLTAVMIYLRTLVGMQEQFGNFYQNIILGLVSCKRINEILDEKSLITEKQNAKENVFGKGIIVFKNISFGYRDDDHVLKNLDFSVEGGSNIALVAPSGHGKTTIALLLLRLYDPWNGKILIDGNDIRDLKFISLREQVGIALQEPQLWNDTIENNIKFAKEEATEDEVLKVAEMTGINEFVNNLPDKYKTVIGENACKLSEGQKQKIAIARALIKNPKILILDEAMSSMDSASEERILTNIKKYQKGTTIITISHRLSTVMNADLVYSFIRPSEMTVNRICDLNNCKDFMKLFAGQQEIPYTYGNNSEDLRCTENIGD